MTMFSNDFVQESIPSELKVAMQIASAMRVPIVLNVGIVQTVVYPNSESELEIWQHALEDVEEYVRKLIFVGLDEFPIEMPDPESLEEIWLAESQSAPFEFIGDKIGEDDFALFTMNLGMFGQRIIAAGLDLRLAWPFIVKVSNSKQIPGSAYRSILSNLRKVWEYGLLLTEEFEDID